MTEDGMHIQVDGQLQQNTLSRCLAMIKIAITALCFFKVTSW